MTTVTIPLDKNPELAALVSDAQPGDWITLDASIKSKDEQTLTVRLERCDSCEKPEGDDEDAPEQKAGTPVAETPEEPAEKPSKKLAKQLTSTDASVM